MKAFIIDDDEFILELYERVFKLDKHETETAHDGVEAYSMLNKMKDLPDVIVLDIMMPRMNGFEFLEKVKADEKLKNIPVIILSNLYGREDRKKGVELGAASYMVKSEHEPKEVVSEAKKVLNN